MQKNSVSFKGYTIVSCGTLSPELNYLKNEGFLDTDRILYTKPGLHEVPDELQRQLKRQLDNAKRHSSKIIVIYGSRCYIDSEDPFKDMDKLVQEHGGEISRVNAKDCIDALVAIKERGRISQGKKVYWLSPGWLKYWRHIFKGWDAGKANEAFPQNEKAILLDALGIYDKCLRGAPEKVLEFSDWMAIPIEPYKISLDRFKGLLSECL